MTGELGLCLAFWGLGMVFDARFLYLFYFIYCYACQFGNSFVVKPFHFGVNLYAQQQSLEVHQKILKSVKIWFHWY